MKNLHLLKYRIERLTDLKVAEVLEYISIMESVKLHSQSPDLLEEAILGLLLQVVRDEPNSRRLLSHGEEVNY